MHRRKRSYNDDADNFQRFKKRRTSETVEIEDRLEALLMKVGEKSTSSLESNLEGLVSVVEADLSSYKPRMLKLLVECAVKFPDKCTIYTTLIGLLNTKNYNFGGECVDLLVRSLKENLKSSKWEESRYLVRFLSDLVNCHVISASSLLQLLDHFVDAALEENVPQVRRDWFAFAVLSALPWVGRELYEKKESELDRMLASLEGFIKKRSKTHHGALRVFSSEKPHPQEEYLDCLWNQIKRLRSDLWVERHIARPYLSFDQVLSEALQHNLPSMVAPPHHPLTTYPLPRVIFRMFDYTDCPEGSTLPGQHSIERFLIEEQLTHILNTHAHERKECAAQLLSYQAKNHVPLEYMIVEVILAELFRLPNPDLLEIGYGSILIELCKLQPATMPQVLAQGTELLYERVEDMNKTCFDRFVSWFAYHLSNFQFRWSWEDWDGTLKMHPEDAKPKFVKEVLLKCLRLSYHQRLVDFTPPSYSELLPSIPQAKFKYGGELSPGVSPIAHAVAQKLLGAIKAKASHEECMQILEEIPIMEPDKRKNESRINVFMHTLLFLGSKSFSHSFAAIAKFHPTLKELTCNEKEEPQRFVLEAISELWSTHHQMMVMIVDKLLKTEIIQCADVANWIFSKEMSKEFTKSYVWEILHLTIRKMNMHVSSLTKDAQTARRQLDDTDSESEESEDEATNKNRRASKQKLTEEQVEKLEEKLEAVQADQKNLFLIIFQRFIMILSEYLMRADASASPNDKHWYNWTIGRLQQVFMVHHKQVEKYSSTLETLLFTQDLDPMILDIFQQFVALRM